MSAPVNCRVASASGKTPASQDPTHSIFNVLRQNHLAPSEPKNKKWLLDLTGAGVFHGRV